MVEPVDLKPGLLEAVEVIRRFQQAFKFVEPKGRKRFDITDIQLAVKTGFSLVIEDIEAAAGLREPWKPASRPETQPERGER